MTDEQKLYLTMLQLGVNYSLGITTWPDSCSFFDSSIKSKWLCGIPYSSGEDDEYEIDYVNYAYGETALEAAEKALNLKENKNDVL